MNPQDTITSLQKIHTELTTAIELANQDLLKSDKEHALVLKTKESLSKLKPNLDEISQLKIEKMNFGWTMEPKPGFINKAGAEKNLIPLLKLVEEMLKTTNNEIPAKNIFIPPNTPFYAAQELQKIYNTAKNKIFIFDNYLKVEILNVLETYLQNNQNLTLQFLTQKGQYFNHFTTTLKKLVQQYPNNQIKLRYYNDSPAHDRYIIIDDNDIYHSGHTVADLGNKSSIINKIEEQTACEKAKQEITTNWNNGTIYILS